MMALASNKCAQCGLVNFAANATCRRCGAGLHPGGPIEEVAEPVPKERGFGRKLLWIFGATLTLLFVCFMSLLATSERLDFNQRQTVADAIAVLEQAGFSREAFVLGNLVNYRSTDNWWNEYVGHQSAYAATNFPFEVVTLYPAFFQFAVDDTERAAILLHESYHLFGAGEEAALQGAWVQKERIGWSTYAYSQTKVWKNTREWTAGSVPLLFKCGMDRHSDCVE
jgi:hypothetical protein